MASQAIFLVTIHVWHKNYSFKVLALTNQVVLHFLSFEQSLACWSSPTINGEDEFKIEILFVESNLVSVVLFSRGIYSKILI